jgi:hypothetical protein
MVWSFVKKVFGGFCHLPQGRKLLSEICSWKRLMRQRQDLIILRIVQYWTGFLPA